MYTQWLLQQPRTITLYTHESVYTQCFPVRFVLSKTGASLSIEMTVTVALKVLRFTDLATQFSWVKVSASTTSFELSLDSTSGQSSYQVWDKWLTCQTANKERHSDPKLRQHLKAFENFNISQVDLIHLSQTEWWMSPISLSNKIRMELQWDLARTSPSWEAPGRNHRPSLVLLLNPVQLLLLLVGVVSSACSSF